MILTASQAMGVGDQVWLYYTGHNHTHGHIPNRKTRQRTGAVGLATWKRDRFVSADGPAEGATLTTVPLKFDGNYLEVNASTKPQGAVRVELLDPAGQPLQGFAMSEPITGDSLRHRVVFSRKKDLSALVGKPICLRFHLRDSQLFAFAFRKHVDARGTKR